MRAFAALAVLAAIMSGCSAPERACTLIGASPGVGVTVERSIAAEVSALRLRICSGETCAAKTVRLDPGSDTVGPTCTGSDPNGTCSATASPNGTLVGFVEVDGLAEGAVRVSATATVSGRSRRYPEITVTAKPVYPNGPDCGGLGPQAQVTLAADGLR